MVAQRCAHFGRGHQGVAAWAARLAGIVGMLKTQRAQAGVAVVHAVAVKVQHMKGPAFTFGLGQRRVQRWQAGRLQQRELNLAGQRLHRINQGAGAGAVVDVAAGLVLGSGADQQHPNRRGQHRHSHRVIAGQPAPHPHRPRALKQEVAPVVQQLPGQAQQQRGGLAHREHIGRLGAWQGCGVDFDREAQRRGAGGRHRPGFQHLSHGLNRQRGLVQQLAPIAKLALDAPGPVGQQRAGPDGIVFEVPAQVVGLDHAQRGLDDKAGAVHLACARAGRQVHQPGAGTGAAAAVGMGDQAGVAECQQQFFNRLGRGLGRGCRVGGQATPQRDKNRVQRVVQRIAAYRDMDRFFVEQRGQAAQRRGVQQQRHHRKQVGPAALGLHGQRVLQLFADPGRGVCARRHQHQHAGRAVNRAADGGLQWVTAMKLTRVDGQRGVQLFQRTVQGAHDAVVTAGMRDEKGVSLGWWCAHCSSLLRLGCAASGSA